MTVFQLRDEGDGDVLGYFTYGHVDLEDFCREITVGWDGRDVISSAASHTHARSVPRPQWGRGSREFVISNPGRGAFAVTYMEVG